MTGTAPPDPGERELTESERVERREFARGHVSPGEPPPTPRPAATMVLARPAPGAEASPRGDGSAGGGGSAPMELLFLRRPDTARFAAGAWVFPGGVVDAGDRAAGLGGRFGPRVTRRETAALVAALREGFEETGLLPSDRRPPEPAAERARERLLAGETDVASVARRLELEFGGLEAVYFARWITPPRLSRRYDARFFLVRHRGGEARPVHGEHTDARWLPPAEAMRRFEAGGLPMLYPTRRTVADLVEFDGLRDAFRAFRERPVEPMRPRLFVRGGAITPVLPGDPRYGDAAREAGGPDEGGGGP